MPSNTDATPYQEPLLDRKLFLSELIGGFKQWQDDNAHALATTQPIIDNIHHLQQLAEPLWYTDADRYTPEQTDLLGDCHVLAHNIEGQIIQHSADNA